jgi:hypothetical protein
MEVVEFEKNCKIAWRVKKGDPEWIDTHIHFELEQKEKGVQLLFSHNDWRIETEFMAHCNFQWGKYLMSLKQYCETGKGTPFLNE